jgi:hypothetical protein
MILTPRSCDWRLKALRIGLSELKRGKSKKESSYAHLEPGRRSAAKLLSKDEARRIASNIAKLPETPQTIKAAKIV